MMESILCFIFLKAWIEETSDTRCLSDIYINPKESINHKLKTTIKTPLLAYNWDPAANTKLLVVAWLISKK